MTRRWIAGAGGILVNALVLGGLALLERAPPVAETPVMVVELERAKREPERRSSATAGAKAGTSSAQAQAAAPIAVSGESASQAEPAELAPSAIDPAWRVDPKAVERWKITEGNPDMGWGRYHRACRGSTNEHMTPEEKERCYDEWGGRRDKRPSTRFVGPIDERKWEDHAFSGPPRRTTADDDKRRRRDLCRAVGRLRKASPSGPPLVRQGACP